jgi:CheY-like chemotaxis protein
MSATECMKVLVVEDSRPLAEAMAYCLRRAGHAVELAADGEVALAALERGGTQLLVLDLGLPGIDGIEVLRRVRARWPRLPVLVSSARDDAQQRLECHALYGDAYVGKPFAVADFERAVAQLAWRFGLAVREAAALPLEDSQRCLLVMLAMGGGAWVDDGQIASGLAAGGLPAAPPEVARCVEGLRQTLSARTPVRLVRVRGLGYGLIAAD